MKLIVLYGLPATGKLTIARQLATLTGYRLFHNHLTVDLLLSTFEFGSPAFVSLREEIWLAVVREAILARLPALLFTFNPESTVRPTFIPQLTAAVAAQGGQTIFIELTCPLNLLKQRIDTPYRQAFHKLTSLSLFERLHATGIFDTIHMPSPALTLDTSLHTPNQSAALIARLLENWDTP